tara:strand:+ start:427 stop:588 length:162 start_codon:yes stop_codon:yes gene_type:complete
VQNRYIALINTYKQLIRKYPKALKKASQREGFERADEEIRTLDILLGKEMLYH